MKPEWKLNIHQHYARPTRDVHEWCPIPLSSDDRLFNEGRVGIIHVPGSPTAPNGSFPGSKTFSVSRCWVLLSRIGDLSEQTSIRQIGNQTLGLSLVAVLNKIRIKFVLRLVGFMTKHGFGNAAVNIITNPCFI